MHHPTDRITHTTAFVTPVVEHWLEREIAQWVHPFFFFPFYYLEDLWSRGCGLIGLSLVLYLFICFYYYCVCWVWVFCLEGQVFWGVRFICFFRGVFFFSCF